MFEFQYKNQFHPNFSSLKAISLTNKICLIRLLPIHLRNFKLFYRLMASITNGIEENFIFVHLRQTP